MEVTATEFKQNLGKYLKISYNESISITKNGKRIAVLSYACDNSTEVANRLVGIIKPDNDKNN